jgi:co-chaperonin GroES (HSP10)
VDNIVIVEPGVGYQMSAPLENPKLLLVKESDLLAVVEAESQDEDRHE